MSGISATFDQLESRNYAVLAYTTRIFTLLTDRSSDIAAHCQIHYRLALTGSNLECMLRALNSPVIEKLTLEQRAELAALMATSHDKLLGLLKILSEIDLGWWAPAYRHRAAALSHYAEELDVQTKTLQAADIAILSLTKRDQEHLVASLLNPPRASERVRDAASRYLAKRYTA